ncbi:MAG: protein kinase, partial [Chloroflexi bacterium]|nr:protein kinase [Chloroflexota bacterium]
MMLDRVGQRLDNYNLTSLLGAGSFAEVYLAEHIYRKERVAVKILPQIADNGLAGFLNEARTMRLKHPHIAQIIDFGVDHHIPFIVMEYAPNGTLRQRHPKGTRVPQDIIVSYVLQIASALQYAHNERVIHRDVKPENLLLGSRREVLVSDFGISMMAHSSRSQSLLRTDGTVAYMAPEQLHGKPRFASDQYAIGVVVYEWLCGDRPFNGTIMEIATQHILTPPPPLHEKMPDISPEVEEVVLRTLAKDPQKRFTTVEAFASALEQAYHQAQKSKLQQPRWTNPNLPVPTVSRSPLSLRQERNFPPVPSPPALNHQKRNIPSIPPASPKQPMPSKASSAKQPIVRAPAQPVSSNPLASKAASNHASSPPGDLGKLDGRTPEKNKTRFHSLLVLIALGVILASGSIYYFLAQNAKSSQAIDATLIQATTLVSQAGTEATSNPGDTLKKLASAQTLIRSIQNSSLTDAQRARLTSLLQIDFRLAVISAITGYNQQNAITMLPCANTTTTTVNTGGTMINSLESIAVVQDENGKRFSYVLGDDSNVYQLDNHHNLVNKLSLPDNIKVTMIASDIQDQRLLALTTLPASGGMPTSYSVSMLAPTPSGALKDLRDTNIDLTSTQAGMEPTQLTAWGTDIYVLLTSTVNPDSTATILDFQVIGNRLLNARSINIATPLSPVSIAAFPNHQLFLLYRNGIIQSFLLSGANQTTMSVTTQNPIANPLVISAKDFTTNMNVPIPSDPSLSSSLLVPGASTLLTG